MKFKLKGAAEVDRVLAQFPANIQRNVLRGALRAGAKPIQERAKGLAQRKSGALARDIVIGSRSDHGMPVGYVKLKGPHAFIGTFMEFGVRPHLIKVREEDRERLGKQTRRGWRRFGIRTVNKMYREGSLKIGKDFVGPVVQHPGIRPMPFMRPALDLGAADALKAVAKYIEDRVQIGDIKAPRFDVEETE